MKIFQRHIPIFLALSLLTLSACKSGEELMSEKMDKRIAEIGQSVATPSIPNRSIDLCELAGYKADEGGSHDFYNDIRVAIDSLSSMGGGTLIFSHSKGHKYWVKQTEIFRVKGPIILKSNIELKFHPSVKLYFEFSPSSYLPDGKAVLSRYEGTSVYTYCPLIYAFNAENIAISTTEDASGAMPIIDGDGERWQKWAIEGDARVIASGRTPAYQFIHSEYNEKDFPIVNRQCVDPTYHYFRPPMMQFLHCKKIKIDGVKLTNSPFWVVNPVFTTDFTLSNVMYDSQNVNNDGIDIESSQRIMVENVIFDNHDDNVVIKSGRNKEGRDGALVKGTEYESINSPYVKKGRITASTENVVVRNCIFKGHYAFCIGSEISGGANEIYVTDCSAPQEVVRAIFLKSSRKRGGIVKDIYLRNLNFTRVKYDAICIIPNYDNDSLSPYPTLFSDVYFNNIQVKRSGFGIRLFGWEDALIKNVSMNKIEIQKIDSLQPKYTFLVNQVENLNLKDVKILNKEYDENYTKTEKGAIPPKQN